MKGYSVRFNRALWNKIEENKVEYLSNLDADSIDEAMNEALVSFGQDFWNVVGEGDSITVENGDDELTFDFNRNDQKYFLGDVWWLDQKYNGELTKDGRVRITTELGDAKVVICEFNPYMPEPAAMTYLGDMMENSEDLRQVDESGETVPVPLIEHASVIERGFEKDRDESEQHLWTILNHNGKLTELHIDRSLANEMISLCQEYLDHLKRMEE